MIKNQVIFLGVANQDCFFKIVSVRLLESPADDRIKLHFNVNFTQAYQIDKPDLVIRELDLEPTGLCYVNSDLIYITS